MISEVIFVRACLVCRSIDLRKSIDRLAVLVKGEFQLSFSPSLFVFCGGKQDKLKILQWKHNGFCFYYCCLEKGKFQWPEKQKIPLITGKH